MKNALVATLLFSAAHAGSALPAAAVRYDHRHLSSRSISDPSVYADSVQRKALLTVNITDWFCPYPQSNDVECSDEYDSVQCGNEDQPCYYTNMCWAMASGFPEDKCRDVCPKGDEATRAACSDYSWAPVQCGDTFCEYDNRCIAEAAGFSFETQCTDVTCPYKTSDTCFQDGYIGLKCSGGVHNTDDSCYYSNLCEAQLSGFAAEECQEVCPSGDADLTCDDTFSPVLCGGTDYCEYTNLCKAKAAGFINDGDCQPVMCPTDYNAECPYEYDYMKCGKDDCIYSNACFAKASGLVIDPSTECSEVCPVPSFADGTLLCQNDEYMPISCGQQSCEYKNSCVAKSAGFSPDEDCVESSWCPFNTYASCPYNATTTTYTCGKEECSYNSLCEAEAVGFSAEDCIANEIIYETSCPYEFDNISEECMSSESAPVYCGDDNCYYSSQCEATEAGRFSEEECSSAECLAVSENNSDLCDPDEWNPVRCGPIFDCFFASECKAAAAGYDLDSQCIKSIH